MSRRIDNQLRGRAGRQGDGFISFLLINGRCADAYFCFRPRYWHDEKVRYEAVKRLNTHG